MSDSSIHVSSPGRICLFGEHLDYLELPVIAAAINMRMHVEITPASGVEWVIEKPDLGQEDRFRLGTGELEYSNGHAADFLRAAVNVVRGEGVALPAGAHCRVWGEVPIQAGTSSSSALQIAWTSALLALAGDHRAVDPLAVSGLAYQSEVVEFDGSGGMMDQYSSAMGGLIRINPGAQTFVRSISAKLGSFVLGNSLEPKDTQGILSRVQGEARRGATLLAEHLGGFDWQNVDRSRVSEVVEEKGMQIAARVAMGALTNRDILERGWNLLNSMPLDHEAFGALLSEHHAILRDNLEISTPKIDRMLAAAIKAGALGGKINGSGGGGCMFAYAPENPEAVAEVIRGEGGEAWVVEISEGLRVEENGRLPNTAAQAGNLQTLD